MARKRAEEAFFRPLAMGDDHGARQSAFELWPQHQQGRGIRQVFRADAMHFSRCPLDGLIGEEVRDKRIVVTRFRRPRGEADLHRTIGFSPRGSGRFEIDGRKSAVADKWHASGD